MYKKTPLYNITFVNESLRIIAPHTGIACLYAINSSYNLSKFLPNGAISGGYLCNRTFPKDRRVKRGR